MAISIDGFSVVVQKNRIQHLLDNHAFEVPNATALADEQLWKCSFMTQVDAQKFLKKLEGLGLNVSRGPDSDAVLVSEIDSSITPYCEWLTLGRWEKAIIAWKTGTQPKSVVAREGWDPKVGSGLIFQSPSMLQHLQFLRLENNVEVFWDEKNCRELYIGRTSTPVDALFTTAATIIRKHFVTAGEPPLTGSIAAEVTNAVEMLRKVLKENTGWWNAYWFYAKGLLALGKYDLAYEAFLRAYDIEKNVEFIPRELAGVCLELRKFDEAVQVAEHAVGLEPDNAELLGNLSLAYLMAGRYAQARKAIDAANRINPSDKINQTLSRILIELVEGRRPAPQSLADLSKPVKPKKRNIFAYIKNVFMATEDATKSSDH